MDKFVGAIVALGAGFFTAAVVYQLVKKTGQGGSEISSIGSTISNLGGDAFKA